VTSPPFALSLSKARTLRRQPFDERAFDKLSPCSGRTEFKTLNGFESSDPGRYALTR